MGKFKVIHRNEKLSWQETCPIEILAIQVSRDTLTGACYLQTKLANISNRTIGSVEINIDLYHNTDHECVDLKLLDADMLAGTVSTPKAVKIALNEVSDSSASVTRVDEQLSFGKYITGSDPEPVALDQTLLDERSALIREAGGNEELCKGRLEEHSTWWQCGCGANNLDRQTCWRCKCPREIQSKALSAKFLEESESNRLYQKAISLQASTKKDDLASARSIFSTLSAKNYKDSTSQVAETDNLIAKLCVSKQRRKKIAIIVAGITAAIAVAVLLNPIVNAIQNNFEAEQISTQIKDASVGDTVAFGTPTSYMGDGQESIEWILLAKKNDKALVISKYCVDRFEFNAHSDDPETADYKDSGLYAYLNGSFKSASFDDAQRSVMASDFLVLDVDTIEKYMPTDSSRIAAPNPKGKNSSGEGESWWTSTNMTAKLNAYWNYYDEPVFAVVCEDGSFDCKGLTEGFSLNGLGVRPAVWIKM